MHLKLLFNVDGLPIGKSSKYQFWPILCSVSNIQNSSPVVVAIYYGESKPNLEASFATFAPAHFVLPVKVQFFFKRSSQNKYAPKRKIFLDLEVPPERQICLISAK